MPDRITVTTQTSFFSRLKSALAGIGIGFLMIAGGIGLLFWNEGRAVTTARTLAEGAGAVISVSPDQVDGANEGRLIHISGRVQTRSPLTDTLGAVSANGLRLERNVEMFQWVERSESQTRNKLGGGTETVTTYTYTSEWSPRPVNSSSFQEPTGHQNPPFSIDDSTVVADDARLGAFALGREIAGRIPGAQPLAIDPARQPALQQALGGRTPVRVVDGRIYVGFNPTTPRIGDMRIAYQIVPAGDASIIGAQRGNTLGEYRAEAGGTILLVESGLQPASAMFDAAISANTALTWGLRVGGIVILMIGFSMLLAPLAVVADIIPPVGSLVRMGTGFAGFILAALTGSVTIAIAWFAYRPVLSAIILGVGLLVTFGLAYLRKGKGAPHEAAA